MCIKNIVAFKLCHLNCRVLTLLKIRVKPFILCTHTNLVIFCVTDYGNDFYSQY